MLRRRLTYPAAAIAIALSLVLTGLGIWAGQAIVSIMSRQLLERMTETVRHNVDDMISFGDGMSTRMVNEIARNDTPFDDPVALRRQLYGQVVDEPNVRWLACGNDAGGMTDAGRLADGTLVFLMTDGFHAGMYREYGASPDGQLGNLRKSGVYFDTREQVWYKTVKETGTRYWTEPYLGSVERLLGVGLSAPVFNKDGSFAGVCNVKLIFTALADFMKSLRIGDNGRAFIIDGTGQLIAASGGVSPVKLGTDGKEHRLHAVEADDPIVRETAAQLGQHDDLAGPSVTEPQVFSFVAPGQGRIYAAVERFAASGTLNWTIVSALPASDFMGPVYRAVYISVAFGVLAVIVSLAVGLWATRRALRPMTELTKAAQAIAQGEWQELPAVRRKDEIGLLAQAFHLMTARLKETLDGLRRSEARLEEAQRVAHVGYWERELDTGRIAWSDETYRIYGLTPGQGAITLPEMLEIIHPEDRQMWQQAVAEALSGGPRYDLEYRVIRPDGELRIVHSQGDVTGDGAGQPRRMFGTIQDITERKQATDALREVQMELAHVNRVTTMGQLTASIAHEVNQPIAATVTNADAALRWLGIQPPDLAEAGQALDRIIKDGKRAGDVIGRIRALIKKVPPRKDQLDINESILEVIALTRSELLRHRIALRTELAEGLPLVNGDRVQLQQVMLNLIINAVEAMSSASDAPRELTINTAREATASVLVAVRDSGPGLDPQSADRLFDAFYTTKSGGMGMGLSICRSIIEAHGGRVWATTDVVRGAVFQFTLPALPETVS
jgi:PAS domain S-box-containing protein